MQHSIVKAADSAIEESEHRQQEARRDREAAAARERAALAHEAEEARAEIQTKVDGIRAESEALMMRLGLRKDAGARPRGA